MLSFILLQFTLMTPEIAKFIICLHNYTQAITFLLKQHEIDMDDRFNERYPWGFDSHKQQDVEI